MDIPDWLPLDAWAGFVAMRKQIKKPLTPRAEKMAIAKLLDFKEQGQDIEKVLEQSEFNCWQDLYEVKAKPVARVVGPVNLHVVGTLGKAGQATANNAQAWLERQKNG